MTLGRAGYVGMIIGLVIAAVVGIIYVTGGIMSSTADFRGEVDERERVEADGGNRVAQHNEFFELCSDIQTANEQIKNFEDRLEMGGLTDTQKRQLQDGLFATEQTKEGLVAKYNTRANNEDMQGLFRDSELPSHIDSDDMEVECGSAS